jgi:hypothetical protein
MRNEIEERICDECGKTVRFSLKRNYGKTPFHGWIKASVEGVDGLSSQLDFCSSECAGKRFAAERS